LQRVALGTFSGVSTSVNITGLPTGYSFFTIVWQVISVSGDSQMGIRLSNNNGSSYVSSGYSYGGYAYASDTGNFEALSNTRYSPFNSTGTIDTGRGGFIEFTLYQPNTTGNESYPTFESSSAHWSSTGKSSTGVCTSFSNNTYINAIQLNRYAGSGTLTGSYIVYGGRR
jgi:hypothetical protein